MKIGKTLIKSILDIIMPKTCIGCKKKETFLCEDCFSLIEINPYRYCFCDHPQRLFNEQESCSKCKGGYLNKIYSASYYEDGIIKKLISEAKYHFQIKKLCAPLSILILTHLKLINFEFTTNMILIPIPLYKTREKWRGFNQSKEIIKIITNQLNIPYSFDNLIKTKNTKNQAKLRKTERLNNLKECFTVLNKEIIKNKIILLIDDLYTTGSTMEECAKTLKENGAKYVYGITVSREILT